MASVYGVCYIIPSTDKLIHKVEVVALVRKVYRNAERGFLIISVDDGSACMQCLISNHLVQEYSTPLSQDVEVLGSALTTLSLTLTPPSIRIGHMIRLRGIVSGTPNHRQLKRLKVLEFGIEQSCDAFSDWIFEVRDVWNNIFSGSDTGLLTGARDSGQKTLEEHHKLWTAVEPRVMKLSSRELDLATLQDIVSREAKRLLHDDTFVKDRWDSFLSYLIDSGPVFKDNSGRVLVATALPKLISIVIECVKGSGELKSVTQSVCSKYKSGVTRAVVKYVLGYLEQESVIYSDVDENNCQIYKYVSG